MLKKSGKIVFAVLGFCLAGSIAQGAGFDCRPYVKSRACPEIIICDTPELSRDDDQMARLYGDLRRRLPPRSAIRIRDEQRLWLQQRSNCACDATCISQSYQKRLRELVEPVDTAASNDAADNGQYVSHWTCTGGGVEPRRYALKIVEESYTNREGDRVLRRGTIELVAKNPPSDADSFRIERGVTETLHITSIASGDVCGKYGWIAEDGDYAAVFCGYTQGAGSIELTPKGASQPVLNANCDSADVN